MHFRIQFFACLALAIAFLAGCKKKEAATAESAPPPEPATAEAAPGQSAAAPAAPAAPVNVQTTWHDSEAAAKKKDYEGAAAALLKVYVISPQLSEKEAQENFKKMIALQKQLADASASGDASAQRAFKMMSDIHEAQRRRR